MVQAVDGLIGISGSIGTEQQLAFAFATEKPALPVPCFKGKSAEIWREHRELLVSQLRIEDAVAATWEKPPRSKKEARDLADEMVSTFFSRLTLRCFVIMPFATEFSPLIDFIIDPVVRSFGDDPIHLGRREQPGDVGRQITDGISKADYVICVLDGMRSNVLYELGMAHALGKPSILLWNTEVDKDVEPPFDIVQKHHIPYTAIDNHLKPRLAKAIRHIRTQLHGR